MPVAITTSLLIITLISASGFTAYLFIAETIRYDLLSKIIAKGIVGMIISQKISPFIANHHLRKLFAVLLFCVVLLSLLSL